MSAAALKLLEIQALDYQNRLRAIGGMEPAEYTDEVRAELSTLRDNMGRNADQQTALKLGGVGDPAPIETRTDTPADSKLAELRERVGLGPYVAAAMAGRPVLVGAEAEYNQERGIKEDFFPMELLARSLPEPLETRALRDGDAATSQSSWLDRVFYDSAAAKVGITFQSVAPGVAAHPVTTVGGSGVQRGRTQAVAESTYTVAVTEMKPSRHAVHGIYSIEDDMRLPGMADAIERDMRESIVDSVDLACFNSDTGANENVADITGMKTAGISESTLTQANKVMADDTLALLLAYVDGRYAAGMSDLNIVTSVGTNVLWYSTIHAATVDNQTIAQFLMASGITWSARGGIDTSTLNGDFGVYIGLNRGIDGAGIAAVWESGQLVRDPYSKADTGEVELTLNYLWSLAFPRTANFKRIKFVT